MDMKKFLVVCMDKVVGAGSSHDPPQAMGMAHFLEVSMN